MITVLMSSAPPVYINMERVSRYAIITHTGWLYVPTEKVSALLRKTGWFQYKLAIGIQKEEYQPPLKLRWTRQLTAEYDPSLAELFDGISLDHGQNYFLMVSHLHEGLKAGAAYTRDEERMSPDPNFSEALWRYRDLYMPTPGRDLYMPPAPTGPSRIVYMRQPSDKRPAEAPPDGQPGAKFPDTGADLAALRRLLT